MAVAENHRPPRTDVVEVADAVDVGQPLPLGLPEEDRLAADATEGAGRKETAPQPPKRPRPSGKEQLPLGSRPLQRPSIASALIVVDPPGARRAAKARRVSALF